MSAAGIIKGAGSLLLNLWVTLLHSSTMSRLIFDSCVMFVVRFSNMPQRYFFFWWEVVYIYGRG